ncbi:hypothetical protein [Gracilibacillus sp. YIM 98692]|uniref:hypothetical protein n=1 Tax=Gracilibacillus sp. YIM 98692 TaxID=2663532 RepID=UPI0013D39945|nr:hypothetical protein [Gracilibacillus sp. YIM 98692]
MMEFLQGVLGFLLNLAQFKFEMMLGFAVAIECLWVENWIKQHMKEYMQQQVELREYRNPLLEKAEKEEEVVQTAEDMADSVHKEPVVSELDEAAVQLLEDLQAEFAEEDQPEEPCIHVEAENCLTMEDWSVDENIDEIASDDRPTFQPQESFVASVVGFEANFLHLNCSGRRTWKQVADHIHSASIELGDLVLVHCDEQNVVTSILTLDTDVSDDYIIPDEEYDRKIV